MLRSPDRDLAMHREAKKTTNLSESYGSCRLAKQLAVGWNTSHRNTQRYTWAARHLGSILNPPESDNISSSVRNNPNHAILGVGTC